MQKKPQPLSTLAAVASAPRETVMLDAVDRKLLGLLARNARLSQRRLAEQLRMSPPAIGDRLARLEREGVIRGYAVAIDWSLLGYVTTYIAVTATAEADQGAVMSQLYELPEVEDVVVVTGSFDMFVRLRVRDHLHLRRFLLEHIWQLDGIQRTDTFLSLAELPGKHLALTLLADDAAEENAPQSAARRSV
jgi:Lrp/AsnC family transcriptional regulator, leucine-responsive regulatory protein